LVGDAGYCASPYSGMGTSAALVGAYVLAGEINRNPGDIPKAFADYQTTLRPFVDNVQAEVNPKILRFGFPQGRLGISTLLTLGAVGSFLRLPELAARFAKEDRGGAWPLPDYPRSRVDRIG
ncbi:MAG TPA: oxidoreductase, partial [Umezawaea sp.]|nr:oxidoreductase [Umezawaea sp.]